DHGRRLLIPEVWIARLISVVEDAPEIRDRFDKVQVMCDLTFPCLVLINVPIDTPVGNQLLPAGWAMHTLTFHEKACLPVYTSNESMRRMVPSNCAPGRSTRWVLCDPDILRYFIEQMQLEWILIDAMPEALPNSVPPKLFRT